MTKKLSFIIWLCAVLCLLYCILASRPLGKELHFTSVWTVSSEPKTEFFPDLMNDSSVAGEAENKKAPAKKTPSATEGAGEADSKIDFSNAIPFKMAQNLGYFTPDGKVLSNISFPYKAAISADSYAVYGMDNETIDIFSPDGSKSGQIDRPGFLFFHGKDKFLLLPGGASFAELEDSGKIKWIYEYTAPLTALSSSESAVIAGYADGKLITFDHDGKIDQELTPSGSDYPVILGAAVSKSGDKIAALCGQGGQRFIIAEKIKGHTEITFHEYMEKPLSRQVLIAFKDDESAVYYDTEGGLKIAGTKNKKSDLLPLKGRILSIQESDTKDGNVYVLSRNDSEYTVTAVEPFSVNAGSFSFKATTACLTVKKGSLYVGRDGQISRIDVSYK